MLSEMAVHNAHCTERFLLAFSGGRISRCHAASVFYNQVFAKALSTKRKICTLMQGNCPSFSEFSLTYLATVTLSHVQSSKKPNLTSQ